MPAASGGMPHHEGRPQPRLNEATIATRNPNAESLEQLIAAAAGGDEQAFHRLYLATVDTLFGVALRIVRRTDWAEEVLQESFVSVWRHAGRFDRAKGAPMTWLIRIVRNQALDWIHPSRPDARERAHESISDWNDDDWLADTRVVDAANQVEWAADAQQARRVGDCLRRLDPRQRQSIALVFFHGLSHSDLARHLQQPLGTAKAWVRRGLKSLRACLAAQV